MPGSSVVQVIVALVPVKSETVTSEIVGGVISGVMKEESSEAAEFPAASLDLT